MEGERDTMGTVLRPELGHDALDVRLDGVLGEAQENGDLPVGETTGNECQHANLASAEVSPGKLIGGFFAVSPRRLVVVLDPMLSKHDDPEQGALPDWLIATGSDSVAFSHWSPLPE